MGLKSTNKSIETPRPKWSDLPVGTIVRATTTGWYGVKTFDGGRIWIDTGVRTPEIYLDSTPFEVVPKGTLLEVC